MKTMRIRKHRDSTPLLMDYDTVRFVGDTVMERNNARVTQVACNRAAARHGWRFAGDRLIRTGETT